MKLCEWCEQPVEGDNELCRKCLDAQARVAAGKIIPAEPERKKAPSLESQVGSGLLLAGKVLAALVMGAVMIVAALAGSCIGLIGLVQIMSSPATAMLWILGAALLFGVSLLLGYLTWKMFDKPLRPVERSLGTARPPRSIESGDDEV